MSDDQIGQVLEEMSGDEAPAIMWQILILSMRHLLSMGAHSAHTPHRTQTSSPFHKFMQESIQSAWCAVFPHRDADICGLKPYKVL